MTIGNSIPGVVSVGRLYCDLIFTDLPREPSLGTEVYAGGFGIHAGGGACITAAHLAGFGRRTHLAAYLPGPPFDTILRSKIEAVGVDLRLSRSAASHLPPQPTAALVTNGDRAFVTHRCGPAAPRLDPDELHKLGIGHLHIGELATLVEMPELLNIAFAAGLTVSLDCSWDETITAADAAQLIAGVDVFLPNAAEAQRLVDIGVSAPFAPLTVIKEGAGGARAYSQGREIKMPTTYVKALDTTGAGDAFNAGFLHHWLASRDIEAALRAGNEAGGRAVQIAGGFDPKPARAPTKHANLA